MNGWKQRQRITHFIKRRSLWLGLYTVYLVFILISVYAFLAEESVSDIRNDMDEKYIYNLVFTKDGASTHYVVTRHDSNASGKIVLTNWTQDNKLDISKVENIRSLKIDVQSMFEDESDTVFKQTYDQISTMDMDYWLEAGDGIFTVDFNIGSEEPLETLIFTKFPTPKSVKVNNQEWWKTDLNYDVSGTEITISDIPTGKTTVVLYFKLENKLPVAKFSSIPATHAGVNENITFDGTSSSDSDGSVKSWLWNFGDGFTDSGQTVVHRYSKPGTFTVRLTVRDDAEPFGEAWVEKKISVAFGAEDDFDSDGLRDIWEWEYFNSTDQTGGGDYDTDGATNKEEHDAGTNPVDPESKPPKMGGSEEPSSNAGMLGIIAVVVIVVVLLVVVMFVLKAKKAKEEAAKEEEAIAELEAKIKQAKKLGLPTREMEKILKNAKEGKPIDVAPIKEKGKRGPPTGGSISRGRR